MCDSCHCGDSSQPAVTLEFPVQDQPHGSRKIVVERDVLDKNNALATTNRQFFNQQRILALNLLSSPGSGKTSLLERTVQELKGEMAISVIEGDQQTSRDAERIRATGASALQINTGSGCHLDAEMIHRALPHMKPLPHSLLFIENVGNLVCPALFDLGEAAKVAIISVTEGEDKPQKYPYLFRAASLCLINKIDLLPYLDFDLALCQELARQVNPALQFIALSAKSGEGLADWYQWLRHKFDHSHQH